MMKSLLNLPFNIIRRLWRLLCLVRDFVFNLIFLFVVIIGIGLFNLVKPTPPVAFSESALRIYLNGNIADNGAVDDVITLIQNIDQTNPPTQISTFDVVYAIRNAIDDQRITGIVLHLDDFLGGDMPSIQYIGEALNQFKQSGKPVFAVARNYSQAQYLLASYADEIYLNPMGEVAMSGFGYNGLYFKSLLDKLEVTPHIFRVGSYKSAVEPFIRDDMSAEARQDATRWLTQKWNNYLASVAHNRSLSIEQIMPAPQQLLTQLRELQGDTAKLAKQQGIVTDILSDNQMDQKLQAVFGEQAEQAYRYIDLNDYLAHTDDRTFDYQQPKIAVINIEGDIIDGESYQLSVGGDSIAQLLQRVSEDPYVKALILRINSPGGSAFASEIIRQQIIDIKNKNIPVIVSMGGMAASGGYWIAANADYIVADPNTITGSIGIFSAFFTLENTLKKAGIHSDSIHTTPFNQASLTEPLSPEVSEYVQINIDGGYQRFLDIVAEGRKLNKNDVDNIAQGRIWLGQEALQQGLIDELGNFDAAINRAQKLINERREADTPAIDDLKVQWFVEQDGGYLSRFLKSSKAQLSTTLTNVLSDSIFAQFNTLKTPLGTLSKFNDPKGMYIYCLNCSVSQ